MRVEMELAKEIDLPATRNQEDITRLLNFLPTHTKLRPVRKGPLSTDETEMRHRFPTGYLRAAGENFPTYRPPSVGAMCIASTNWRGRRGSGTKRRC